MPARAYAWLVPILVVAALPAHADSISTVDNSLDISFQRTRLNYGETVGSRYVDSEHGAPHGVRIAATGLNDASGGNMFVQLQYSYTSGDVNYTGALLSNGSPVTGTSGAQLNDWQAKLGVALLRHEGSALIPYIAVSGHRWVRTVGKGTTGEYQETYSHDGITAGLLAQTAITRRSVLSMNVAGGRTVGPHIDVPAFGLSQDLGTAGLLDAGLDVDYRLASGAHVFAAFDYTRYRYGQSAVDPITGLYEPDSKTELVSYNVGLRLTY